MQALLEEKMEKNELKKKQQEEMAQLAQWGSSRFRSPLSSTSPTASTSVTIGPCIRKQRLTLDSIFAPCTALGAQPSLESMAWNKENHEQAKLALGDFFFYNNLPFNSARYL